MRTLVRRLAGACVTLGCALIVACAGSTPVETSPPDATPSPVPAAIKRETPPRYRSIPQGTFAPEPDVETKTTTDQKDEPEEEEPLEPVQDTYELDTPLSTDDSEE